MRVLELFAGAGGATTGLIDAGMDVVRCIERDPDAHATALAAGHPSVKGDVRDAGLDVPADLVWSSFPCQAWSLAGKRLGAADERNGWPWTSDTLGRLRPRWFIGENVVGLATHARRAHGLGKGDRGDGRPPADPRDCPGCYFERVILRELREQFAAVSWRILDAADYGVPQRRRRVIIVAGPRDIAWPRPTHHGPEVPPLLRGRLRPWVSMREALGLRAIGAGANPRGPAQPGQRTRREISDEPSTTISTRSGNALPEVFSPLDAPASTLTGGSAKSHVNGRSILAAGKGARARLASAGVRRVSVAEAATLQAFPPNYPWQGTQTSAYRQVGNAVPPTLAEVVGRAVLAAAGELRRTG